MYSNLLNLLLFSFFFSFVKKEKGKRAVVNAGRRLRPKQERESRACLRVFFLSEKSTLFERVRGAMLRARIFFVYRRAAESDVDGGRWTGRRWVAGGTHGLWTEQHRKNNTRKARGKREDRCFSFSRGKIGGILALSSRRKQERSYCDLRV